MRILFLFLLISGSLFAGKPEWIPDYFVNYAKDSVSTEKGTRLKFVCSFDSDYTPHRTLRYGIDGSDESVKLDDHNVYEFISTPGTHVFQFFYDFNFQEISTDSIEVKAGQITIISLHFKNQVERKAVKKPVIYTYPETDLPVSITLETKGNLTFTYPDYKQGWQGTAHPDGSIEIAGKNYPYLFWESEQRFNTFDQELGGFIIQQENLLASLEEHLTQLGFNEREKTDFITFWGPQLAQHRSVLVQFVLNESCDVFASLSIEPKPEHLNRVYIIWSAFDNSENDRTIKPQLLSPLNRDGFDVLEWGGVELNITEFVNRTY